MTPRVVWLLPLVLCAMLSATARAADQHSPMDAGQEPAMTAQHPVTATLIAEHTSIRPRGTTRIGVQFEIAEGWHIYAKEPGDAGLPTQITWTVPAGITMSELHWPKATRFTDAGDITTYGYAGSTLLYSTLTAGSKASGADAIPIHAKVRWLACLQLCLPGSAELDLALPISASPQTPSADARTFE